MIEPDSKILQEDEAMAKVNGYLFPVCVDTGAWMSLIPKELANLDSLTGRVIRSKMVNGVTMDLDEAKLEWEVEGIEFEGKVGVVEGEKIGWVGLLSVCFSSEKDLELMRCIVKHKMKECSYIPPYVEGVTVHGARIEKPVSMGGDENKSTNNSVDVERVGDSMCLSSLFDENNKCAESVQVVR